MGNPGSTGYLVIQLFSSQLLGLCPDYGTTPVILLCGVVVLVIRALRPSWFNARNVRPWYGACTVPFQNTCTTL